ncbi:lysophospholipid acyltransferase family protein [Streptomyces sp. NPDC050560]|uniref:lysophospholipid acyltransferase family protein n=1 Tax=Streptomyces sp. NPDC050560 TaxID=3365630 RepID=UPI003793D7E8
MSFWQPTAPCTPDACVPAAAGPVAPARAAARLAVLAAVFCAGVALVPAVARLPAAPRDRLVRLWCRALVRCAGVRARFTGTAPRDGGLLLVANHISWLDIPLLAAVRPARMLAKREIRDWPVAGRIAALGGTLFITRDRPRALPGTVAGIAEALRAGSAAAAFPEGSTWCGRGQGTFRRAVFQAAVDAGVPVQPVRITYRLAAGEPSTVPAFVGGDTLAASLWRVAAARGVTAEVRVLAPLTDHEGGRRTLAGAAQAAVVPLATAARDDHAPGTGHVPAPRDPAPRPVAVRPRYLPRPASRASRVRESTSAARS